MLSQFLILASASGFLAVALGAFAAHGLESRLDAELLSAFQTGVSYHMYHSLALLGIAALGGHYPNSGLLKLGGYLMLLGIVLFSGSLYTLSLTGISWLGAVTPLGGLCFLAGWGCLFRFALGQSRH